MSVNATAARCSRRMWLASSKPPVARHYGQEGDRRSENVGAPALISIHGSPPGEECRASLTIPLVPQARPLTRRHSDLTSPTAWDSASPSAGRSPKRVAASCDTSRIPEAARSFASPPPGFRPMAAESVVYAGRLLHLQPCSACAAPSPHRLNPRSPSIRARL